MIGVRKIWTSMSGMQRTFCIHGFVLIAFIVLCGIFFFPVIAGEASFLSHDNLFFFFPAFMNNPIFWDPMLQGGFPVSADPQFQTFYPFLYFFPKTTDGFNAYVFSFIVMACFFSYLFAFEITKSILPSFCAGMIYGLSGSLVGQMTMISITGAAAWLPFIVLSFYKIMQKSGQRFWFASASLSLSMGFLVGHPQLFIHILLFLGLMTAFHCYKDGVFRPKVVIVSVTAVVIGLLISSISLGPFLELLTHTARSGKIGMQHMNSFEMIPLHLSRLVFPYILGAPATNDFIKIGYVFHFTAFHNFHELHRYFGLLPFLLFIPAMSVIRSRNLRMFFLFSLIFYFIFSLGSQTPLANIISNVPILNRLRGPSRHFLELTLILSALTAIGLKRIYYGSSRNQRIPLKKKYEFTLYLWWGSLLILACLLPVIVLAFIPELQAHYMDVDWFSIRGNNLISVQILLLIGLIVSLIFGLRSKKRNFAMIPIVVLCFADLYAGSSFSDWRFFGVSEKSLNQNREKKIPGMDSSFRIEYTTPNSHRSDKYYNDRARYLPFLQNNLISLGHFPGFGIYSPLALRSWREIQQLRALKPELPLRYGLRYIGGVYRLTYFPLSVPVWNGSCAKDGNPELARFARLSSTISIPDAPISRQVAVYVSILCAHDQDSKVDAVVRILLTNKDGRSLRYQLRYGKDMGFHFSNCKTRMGGNLYLKLRNRNQCQNYYVRKFEVPSGFHPTQMRFSVPDGMIVMLHALSFRENSKKVFFAPSTLSMEAPWIKIYRDEHSIIYENPGAYREAYISRKIKRTTNRSTIRTLLNEGRKYSVTEEKKKTEKKGFSGLTTLVEMPENEFRNFQKRLALPFAGKFSTSIRMYKQKNRDVAVRTITNQASLLILNHTFYPGWKAYTDGKETKIYRVNHTVRGILLPAGKHLTEFRFRPIVLYLGTLMSVLGLLALVMYTVLAGKKRSKSG